MSNGTILGLFAETPLHPGVGQSADVVDLPVAREGATGLPQIPETGLKGALRQWAEEMWPGNMDEGAGEAGRENARKVGRLFGTADAGAGVLMISSARLLCLPIRRLDGPYAWVTTPYLLERLRRDSARCGCGLDIPTPQPKDGDPPELLTKTKTEAAIYLEEFSFRTAVYTDMSTVRTAIGYLLGADEETKARILDQLAIMSDEEFAWYAANALPVNARNMLNENKMSENLWYEEVIPPDALFYSVILPRNEGVRTECDNFLSTLVEKKYLQIGGNETVGQGWVQLARHGAGETNAA